ncbi:MAG TPA: hypothetical protein VG097_20825 [Gemmata sp.]|jgi:hypothetical protein|nr:hypothetical protein [Gemmata sp.]
MTHVVCDVADGLRPAEATVSIRTYSGRVEYLPLDRGMLSRENGTHLLPVGVIYQDESKDAAFVELPDEADSGTSRVWVRLSDMRQPGIAQ